MPWCGRNCVTTDRTWPRSTARRTRSQWLWVWRTCTDQQGRGSGARGGCQCLDPPMTEEPVEQPRIHQADGGEHGKRRRSLDQVALLQQGRDAVADHPGVEAHADAPEG